MQGFHLDLTYTGGGGMGGWGHNGIATFSWGVYSANGSSMFIFVHVGASSDLLCARERKTAFLYDGQSTVLALYTYDHLNMDSVCEEDTFWSEIFCVHHCNCHKIMG